MGKVYSKPPRLSFRKAESQQNREKPGCGVWVWGVGVGVWGMGVGCGRGCFRAYWEQVPWRRGICKVGGRILKCVSWIETEGA